MNTPASPWFRVFKPRPAATHRLLCFAHAGGAASFYRSWPDSVPDWLEVVSVQPPGREDRIREPFTSGTAELADVVTAAALRHLRPPYVLFGHSMGASVAYEVAHRLEEAGPGAAHLFASGRHAPQEVHESAVHLGDDEALIRELARLGGTPEALLSEPGLREIVLPVLRDDYRHAETYRPPERPPLRCPVTAILGDRDPEVTTAQAMLWAQTTRGAFQISVLPGDHFQLVPNREAVTALVSQALTASASWPSTP